MEKGMEKGELRKAIEVILNLYKEGFVPSKIAKMTNETEDFVNKVISGEIK